MASEIERMPAPVSGAPEAAGVIPPRDPSAIRPVYAEAERGAALGLAANFLLAVAKFAAGIVGHSFALIADAINSLGDVITSIVILGALRYAQRPPDEGHPYGHARIEAAAGAAVSILIISSAGAIALEAIRRIGSVPVIPSAWTLWVAGATVVVKESLYQYKSRLARRLSSQVILANAWDHRADAITALAVLAGIAAVRFGGERFRDADGIAALIVVAFILWGGLRLLRGAVHELMDAQAEPAYLEQVRRVACSVSEVVEVEKLLVRKAGLEYLVDIHVEVDPDLTVREGHRIGHLVKDRILNEFREIREVLVHLEPAGPKQVR